jgi:hypothetical protein
VVRATTSAAMGNPMIAAATANKMKPMNSMAGKMAEL